MPALRPLTEIARTDVTFVMESLVPALARAGFRGIFLVRQREPEITSCVDVGTCTLRDPADATISIEGSARDIEALLLGKAREPTALERMKAERRGPTEAGAIVRGIYGALDELVRVCRPRGAVRGGAREIGAEAGAPTLRRKRDRMRMGGRYIKGVSREMAAQQDAPLPNASSSSHVTGGSVGGAGDPIAFALQNLARFVEAGLEKIEDAALDERVTVSAAGASRG